MTHVELDAQTAVEAVRAIGIGLDHQVFPTVADGGLVLPRQPTSDHLQLGKEKCYVERTSGSTAGSRKGTTRRKRTTGGSWPPSPPPSIVRRSSAAEYEEDFGGLIAAYPRSQVFVAADGIWLVAPSTVVEGLAREAVFVAAIPFDVGRTTQGWGFWTGGSHAFAQWIGPRHTNFPHGSICAFDSRDEAWHTGDSTVVLLDLYSVWAARHLHLEFFGRWPGSQTARWPHERRLECRPDELCGCGSFKKTYSECCYGKDHERYALQDALTFLRETNGGERSPPREILEFLRKQISPPSMAPYM